MSNDLNFEPDWDAYNRMGEEERQARRELVKLDWRYNHDKITYEKYIGELDNSYFYPYLSSNDLKKIEDFNKKKEKESKAKLKPTNKNRQIKISHKNTTSDYLLIFILIVSILGFLIGIFG